MQTQTNQALQVTKIINNGYFEENLRNAKILDHYHKFLFLIDISYLRNSYKQLRNSFYKLHEHDTLSTSTHEICLEFQTNLNQVEQILNKFSGNYKVKRGLVNFIGKGIKFITGNLDDDDLNTINENLERLHQNTNNEIERIDKLTSFANHLSKRYSEDVALLNENILKTQSLFDKIKSNEEFTIRTQNLIFQSKVLLNYLLMIERTISFAIFEIPNLELFKVEELHSIEQYLEKIYKPQELSSINNAHLYKLLEFSKISVIGTDKSLTFLLKIPILKQFIANYSQVYPVPNHQDIAIIPPKKYLIKIKNEEYWTDEACRSISNSLVLCLQAPTKEACTLTKPQLCQTSLSINNFKITHVLKNKQLLTIFKKTQEVIEDCHGIIMKKSIQGANLLSSDCKIIIENSIFDNTVPIYNITFRNISKITLKFNHKIEFHLKHLREPTSIIQEAEKLRDEPMYLHPVIHMTHYALSGILLCLMVLGIIAILLNKTRIQELLFSPRKIIHLEMSNVQGLGTDNEDVPV